MFGYDVLCIGSATMDHFLTIERPFSSFAPGGKILVKNWEQHSGGGGTNSAVALSRLGLKVKVLTKVGNDAPGEQLRWELERYKIKNICRHHSHQHTDTSTVIFSAQENDRLILVHKGASLDLSKNDFKKYQLKAQWLYLASLMGKSFSVAREIAEYSQKKRIPLLFNPSSYLAQKGRRYLGLILKATTLLVLNKEEAQQLLKTSSADVVSLLKSLQKLGPETVIITDGRQRLYALHRHSIYSLLPPKVKITDTTGAGDAFTAGLLAGIIKHYTFTEALRLGQANATSVIQQTGAKAGLLSEKAAWDLISRHRISIHTQKLRKKQTL